MTNVPITYGSGQASIAGDTTGGATYQQIKIVDGTTSGTTGLIVNSDGTLNARISGSVATAGGSFTGSVSGTVGASIIGTVPVTQTTTPWIITGSVQGNFAGGSTSVAQQGPWYTSVLIASVVGAIPVTGSFSPSGNQSVSGTVNVGNFPTNQNISGSVVGFQGTTPWIITGSVQGTFSAPTNQSVSGTVQTDVRGSVAVAIIAGSIAASFTPPANQSVSGTVQTDVRGSVATVIIGGSIATATTNSSVMLLNGANTIGSVTALQGTNPWIITGSVQGSFSPSGNQSVSGTVGASIIGTVPTTQSGTRITSIVSTVPSSVLVGASIFGWAPVQWANSSVITVSQSSTAVAIVSGSIAATFTPPANQSVSGTVNVGTGGPVSVTGTMSVLGTVPVTIVSGSIAAIQSAGNTSTITVAQGSVAVAIISGSVAVATGNSSVMLLNSTNVIGSVATLQGTNPWIITGSVQGSFSPAANQSVSGTVQTDVRGSVAAVIIGGSIATATTNSSVMLLNSANVIGSVATLQGTNPWIVNPSNSSIISVIPGSVVSVIKSSVATTFAGNASIVQGVADLRVVQGASVAALSAPGASTRIYVTAVQVSNFGPSSVLVVIADNTTSILGWTIAPAGGGSNYNPYYRSAINSPITASINGVASVLVSMQGFTSGT